MRIFHSLGAAIAAAALLPAGHATLAQEIKISHQWAEVTDARDRATRVFVQEAEARAPGLKFRIHANSSLNIKPVAQLDAMQANTLEMAVYPLVYGVAKVPEFSLAGLPGLIPNLDAAQSLKGSEIHDTLQSIAEANGVRILTWWWAPGGFLTKTREISDPKSVQGLKMRAADPLFELMLKGAGATVASMPSTEIHAALKAGAVDAVLTSYEAFMSLRLYEQAKFATVGNPSLFMGFTPLVMSGAAWKRLTPDQQAAMEEAADISDAYFDAVQRAAERRMIATFRKAGVAVSRMSKDDYLNWLQLAQRTAWLEYTKINPRAQDLLLGTVQTFLEKLDAKEN